jgi:replication-associated recombination protein RarA
MKSNIPVGTFESAVAAATKRLAAIQQQIAVHSNAWTNGKLEAGKILLGLRKAAPHGTWEPQLEKICKGSGIGRSTAHRYMDLAEGKAVKADTKTSKNGYFLDELRSYLHKSLRLGDEDAAMRCMVELSVSGKDESTWQLLKVVFPIEDVGLARIGLLAELDSLYKAWKKTKNDLRFHAYRLPITDAVLLLCRVQKSRLVDDALNTYFNAQTPIVIPGDCKKNAAKAFENSPKIEIPDSAKDKHTAAGRKMGRRGAVGINHFFDEGANLVNETTQPELQNNYKKTARQALLQKVGAA